MFSIRQLGAVGNFVNPVKSVGTVVSVSAVQLDGFAETHSLNIHPAPTPVQLRRFVADIFHLYNLLRECT